MSKLFLIYIFINFFTDLYACRIWAVISKNNFDFNNISTDESAFISGQLSSFYEQSQSNQNGWAVIHYGVNDSTSFNTITRSIYPANQDSLNYWSVMNSLFNNHKKHIGIAHLRTATSGASDIPNPHPWIFEDDRTYSFVHNGGASKDQLYDLITNFGTDIFWLDEHPPQTFGNGHWDAEGWASVIDSELIMLLIMKKIQEHGNTIDGLQSAFSMMLEIGINPYMLNCIFSDSESLYIFGGAGGLNFYESESFFSVMSTPTSLNYTWEPISNGELVVLTEFGVNRYPSFAVVQSNDPDIIISKNHELFPAYPNPFNGYVVIPFSIPYNRNNSVSISNIFGNQVYYKDITRNDLYKGSITWVPNNRAKLSSGLYIIKMISGTKNITSKIMFIK